MTGAAYAATKGNRTLWHFMRGAFVPTSRLGLRNMRPDVNIAVLLYSNDLPLMQVHLYCADHLRICCLLVVACPEDCRACAQHQAEVLLP